MPSVERQKSEISPERSLNLYVADFNQVNLDIDIISVHSIRTRGKGRIGIKQMSRGSVRLPQCSTRG